MKNKIKILLIKGSHSKMASNFAFFYSSNMSLFNKKKSLPLNNNGMDFTNSENITCYINASTNCPKIIILKFY